MDINREILDLWRTANLDKRIPLLYPPLTDDQGSYDILFVGLNPSFSLKGFSRVLKGRGYQHVLHNIEEHYEFTDAELQQAKLDELIEIEKHAIKDHTYHKKFEDIAEAVRKDFPNKIIKTRHIDLLFIRQTKQKEIKQDVKRIPLYKKFLSDQIDLSVKFMMSHNPKLIVICNAYACELFHEKFKPSLQENPNIGADEFIYDGTQATILYSGMLSGQHALDNGSFKRLKWHIKFVLKFIFKK